MPLGTFVGPEVCLHVNRLRAFHPFITRAASSWPPAFVQVFRRRTAQAFCAGAAGPIRTGNSTAVPTVWGSGSLESGYPYEHDQWISAAGAAYATMAIAAAVEPPRFAR